MWRKVENLTLPQSIATILGEFANIESNIVYCEYDRDLNNTNLTLRDVKPDELITIGVDFNNNGMSAVGYIVREGKAHVIYENIGSLNTKTLVQNLNRDLVGKKFILVPDPACTQNRSNSESTDLAILRNANFRIKLMQSHPEVRDRVNSVNARFQNFKGERNLLINRNSCPLTSTALLQQIYNSAGEPTKKVKLMGTAYTHVDGPLDALGYAVFINWPLVSQSAKKITIVGF